MRSLSYVHSAFVEYIYRGLVLDAKTFAPRSRIAALAFAGTNALKSVSESEPCLEPIAPKVSMRSSRGPHRSISAFSPEIAIEPRPSCITGLPSECRVRVCDQCCLVRILSRCGRRNSLLSTYLYGRMAQVAGPLLCDFHPGWQITESYP